METPAVVRAYIGLGSNLEDPVAQVTTALAELEAIPQTHCAGHSNLYRSVPMGPQDQPDYINAVAALDTSLLPDQLLVELQTIEQRHGRTRDVEQWGPRNLDLDILLYGNKELAANSLIIPHPGLHERNFVLYPLAELDPGLEVPGRGRLADLLAACDCQGLKVLKEHQ